MCNLGAIPYSVETFLVFFFRFPTVNQNEEATEIVRVLKDQENIGRGVIQNLQIQNIGVKTNVRSLKRRDILTAHQ